MMMIMWALFFVVGVAVFGYGFARMRGDHGDASKWFTLSSVWFLVALIFRLLSTNGG